MGRGTRRGAWAVWLGACLLVAGPAAAATEGPGVNQYFHAAKRNGKLLVDGKLDEPAWKDAPVFSDFVESWPNEGAKASPRTEVRVLYDDQTLYVGVTCFDASPELIERQLGRRDTDPTSDKVLVSIDSSHSHRNGYLFQVNAGGVLRDGLMFSDTNFTDTWDAVWDAAVATDARGWTAEFAIPLNILRFPEAPVQTWGFFVERDIPRTHQQLYSTLIPRNVSAWVSRFGQLTGMVNLKPRVDVELTPYLAARAGWAPQISEADSPHPRLFNPSGDVGLDLRASLTSSLTLNMAVNPDFGEVDPDAVILNLQNTEPTFPERRLFFNQGLDIFAPVGSEMGAPHQLFYSRRIGLDAPILAAAKITGSLTPKLDVGLLDAVVMGANDPVKGKYYYSGVIDDTTDDEAHPDRSLAYSALQPFHLGLTNDLPAQRATPTNYFAAVARGRLTDTFELGGMATSVQPLGPACTPSDFLPVSQVIDEADRVYYSHDGCRAFGENAAALDFNWHSKNGDYGILGTIDASQVTGGTPDGLVQRDGIVIRGGDTGLGGYLRLGKFGGSPWRWSAIYQYASPKLELNALGYLPSQNQQRVGLNLRYVRPTGMGVLRNFSASLSGNAYATTDGKWTSRGNYASLNVNALLPSFQSLGLNVNWDDPEYDVREVYQLGFPFQRQGDVNAGVYGALDNNKPFYADGDVFLARMLPDATHVAAPGTGIGADFSILWHPIPILETQLIGSFAHIPQGPRFVEEATPSTGALAGKDVLFFANQRPAFLSLTLKQQVVLTPKITLQLYAQLFSDYSIYSPFYGVVPDSPAERIRWTTLMATDPAPDNPNFQGSVLDLNLVFRWEYRLGSTFFAVYSRSQSSLPVPDGVNPPKTLLPVGLFKGAARDVFLLKWSYWWDV